MLSKITNFVLYVGATIFAVVIVFLIIIPSVGISVNGEKIINKAATQVLLPTSTFAPPKLAIPAAIVIKQLESVSELTIVRMETVGVVIVAQDNAAVSLWGWNLWKPDATIVTLESHGIAKAGVDTTKISVDVYDNILTLNLPAPIFLGWEMDTKKSRFVEFNTPYELGIISIGAVRPETATYANDKAYISGVTNACEQNILNEVNLHAQEIFQKWFNEFGYDNIIVNVQNPGDCS